MQSEISMTRYSPIVMDRKDSGVGEGRPSCRNVQFGRPLGPYGIPNLPDRRLSGSGVASPYAVAALLVIVLALPDASLAAAPLVDHRINVQIDPPAGTLTVQDQMLLPKGQEEWLLLLHQGLNPRVTGGDAELTALGEVNHMAGYGLRVRSPGPVTLSYGGTLRHGLRAMDEGMGRARQWSLGTISPDGVFLDANSGWYPRIPDTLQRFDLQVRLPDGWTAVSQGSGPGEVANGRSTWSETRPQEDIYLVAAPFQRYRESGDGFEAQVYLRQPNPELARAYLEATRRYVARYSNLIGPYPFAKFALAENFWETGYGMPSFTLLGTQVIRLPFIIETSFPHEILHNWWGNGVYVDHDSGNWSEGLTYYLADYWLKEDAGHGTEARRDMLKSYADYVRDGKDFPLTEFHERHAADSQSIGYDKGAMLFHMLRRQLGDPAFLLGLRRFYADNRFQAASYGDLRRAFEAASGADLGPFFEAWTQRTGAASLKLADVRLDQDGNGFRVRGRIDQTQSGAPYPLRIPVVIEQQTGDPVILNLASDSRDTPFEARLHSRPVRLAVDPAYDLFRSLLPGEAPVALSNLFGADEGLILLPSSAPDDLRDGYRRLADAWTQDRPGWRVQLDSAQSDLPTDRPVWVLGWENRHLGRLSAGSDDFSLDIANHKLALQGTPIDDTTASLILTRWLGTQALAWLAASDAASLTALARKVPHYGKYSYLAFGGPRVEIRVKGEWPSGDSALVHHFETTSP